MNTILLTLGSLVFSFLGLAYLVHVNPKRRRAHKQPKYSKQSYAKLAWMWVLLPLVVLLALGNMPALVMWAMAVSLVGWGLAVKPISTFKSAKNR